MAGAAAVASSRFNIRPDYLGEAENIPDFWISSVEEVSRFLKDKVRKGAVETIGKTAGGRPMRAVLYGNPREGKGTTTFSGSLGFRDVRAFLGPEHGKRVYWAMAAVHGAEFEGIVGTVNLLSILETGRDLRGREWPDITSAAKALDRLIIIPITNLDGRARVPLRMLRHRGTDYKVQEYFNTGGKPDGSLIGWPQCKEHIPLDFSTTQFPGGYPNDAGVNIQHDDFLGKRQPETEALLTLARRERPDLILNLHTGAHFLQPLRPFVDLALTPVFEDFYRRVNARLVPAGLQVPADPKREAVSAYNLDTALNLHCGALSITVESPSHGYSDSKKDGKPFLHTPDNLLDAQLMCHAEAMAFLAETGGRAWWTARKA